MDEGGEAPSTERMGDADADAIKSPRNVPPGTSSDDCGRPLYRIASHRIAFVASTSRLGRRLKRCACDRRTISTRQASTSVVEVRADLGRQPAGEWSYATHDPMRISRP
ncbi:hypothetical protein V9T40_000190 [Parthenolecanium corni]|uniref:Uncharacterized protein n=1 Tax=Parthenolecanium corni TaxID=536013 RepID=A0AAN9TAL8_9HEMI